MDIPFGHRINGRNGRRERVLILIVMDIPFGPIRVNNNMRFIISVLILIVMDIPFGLYKANGLNGLYSCLNPYCNGYSFRTQDEKMLIQNG